MRAIKKFLITHWPALLLLLFGIYLNFFQISGINLQRVAGDLGDTRFIMAIAEYNYQWLIGTYSNYWDGFFMFPDKEVISYSDNLLGSLPIYSVFRFSGVEPIYAFQLLILSSHVLNFIFTYFCFVKLGFKPASSACGAFVFAFSISLAGLYNHPQFSFRYCIPVFFYFFITYFQKGGLKNLIYCSLALVYQFYLGIYLGYFLFICAGAYLLVIFFLHPTFRTSFKKFLGNFAISASVVSALLLPLFWFYYKRSVVTGYYMDYNYYMQTVPRMSSYFKAFDGAFLWKFLKTVDVSSNFPWFHSLFPGFLVMLSLLTGAVLGFNGNKTALSLLLVLALLISFTTYYNGHTLYGYLMKIPGIKAARVVSRINTLLLFFSAWLITLETDWVLKQKIKLVPAFSLLIPCLLVADNWTVSSGYKSFSINECKQRTEVIEKKLFEANPSASKKVFALLTSDTVNVHFLQLDAMLCALTTGRKTINGYSSSCHRYYGPFWREPNEISLTMWCHQMNLNKDSLLIIK